MSKQQDPDGRYGLHEHDGYAPHSHEVRADHLGVQQEAQDPPAAQGMEPIADLTGDDLQFFLDWLEEMKATDNLAVCIDGGLKIKINERTWSPPLGTVRPAEQRPRVNSSLEENREYARRLGITADSPADLGPVGEALAAEERADYTP